MSYLGISAGFHDAAISVINAIGDITFASHSERYSGAKHDKNLCTGLVADALNYCDTDTEVHYYERPWAKLTRQIYSGEPKTSLYVSNIIGKEYHAAARQS